MESTSNQKDNFAKVTGICGSAYFLEDEDYIISANVDSALKIINLKNDVYVREIKFEHSCNKFILSQDKKFLFLIANNSNIIKMIEISSGKIIKTFINEITISEPDLFIVDSKLKNLFSFNNHTIFIWDINSGKLINQLNFNKFTYPGSDIESASLNEEKNLLSTGFVNGFFILWDLNNCEIIDKHRFYDLDKIFSKVQPFWEEQIFSVCCEFYKLDTDQIFISNPYIYEIFLYDIKSKTLTKKIFEEKNYNVIYKIYNPPNSSTLITVESDYRNSYLCFWDYSTTNLLLKNKIMLEGFTHVENISLTESKNKILVSNYFTLHIYDLENNQLLKCFSYDDKS